MDQNLPVLKCPFRNALITKHYNCEHAREVTLRDGPGIACNQADAHLRCVGLFDTMKAATLPVLELEDDLTRIPASVLNKIQYGGLAALSALCYQGNQDVDNINGLVIKVNEVWDNPAQIIADKVVPVICDYRLKRRRDR